MDATRIRFAHVAFKTTINKPFSQAEGEAIIRFSHNYV